MKPGDATEEDHWRCGSSFVSVNLQGYVLGPILPKSLQEHAAIMLRGRQTDRQSYAPPGTDIHKLLYDKHI